MALILFEWKKLENYSLQHNSKTSLTRIHYSSTASNVKECTSKQVLSCFGQRQECESSPDVCKKQPHVSFCQYIVSRYYFKPSLYQDNTITVTVLQVVFSSLHNVFPTMCDSIVFVVCAAVPCPWKPGDKHCWNSAMNLLEWVHKKDLIYIFPLFPVKAKWNDWHLNILRL